MPVPDAKKRFGPFELDSRSGELRTNGTRIKLQGQPISVLEILLETPGELVTREQIHQRLWSSDTFVDFDHNLNTAIKKLRQALGDEAETPRYIETVPRYGYRFIGQVEKDAPPEAARRRDGGRGPHPRRPDQESRTGFARAPRAAVGTGRHAILFAAVAVWLMLKPEPQPSVFRFSVPPPENTARFINGGEMSISPDGRTLAFVAAAGTEQTPVLWLRPLDSIDAQQIPGTEGADGPFWSPDSRQIGFAANGKLEKVDLSGGAPQILCDATRLRRCNLEPRRRHSLLEPRQPLPRARNRRHAIARAGPGSVAPRGQATGFRSFFPTAGISSLRRTERTFSGNFVGAGSLDSKTVERLVQVTPRRLFAPPGYLFYMDQGTLDGAAFNARALHFTGPAVPVAQNIGINLIRLRILLRLSGRRFGLPGSTVTSWDRCHQPDDLVQPRRTETGRAWASRPFTRPPRSRPMGPESPWAWGSYGKRDIWVYDLKRGTASRLTFDPADDTNTAWSADGSRIVFSSNRSGQIDIYQKAANGLGSEQPVFQSKDQAKRVDDMSADGRYAIYDTGAGPMRTELWALPLFGDRKPFAFVQAAASALTALSFRPTAAMWRTPQMRQEERKSTSRLSRGRPPSGKSQHRAGRSRCGAATARSCSISRPTGS